MPKHKTRITPMHQLEGAVETATRELMYQPSENERIFLKRAVRESLQRFEPGARASAKTIVRARVWSTFEGNRSDPHSKTRLRKALDEALGE